MLRFDYFIDQSHIPHSGLGLFTKNDIKTKDVVIFPNQFHQTYSEIEFDQLPKDSIEYISGIRWFDNTYSADPEWSAESHLNHSFTPNCLWHLGFVIALKDIKAGEELTINYCYLLGANTTLDYNDSVTGREIKGLSWDQKMLETSQILVQLFK